MKPENPNAFPLEEKDTAGYHYQTHYGMTLRDYFAAKALNSFLNDVTASNIENCHQAAIDIIAKSSYKIADAMLKARNE